MLKLGWLGSTFVLCNPKQTICFLWCLHIVVCGSGCSGFDCSVLGRAQVDRIELITLTMYGTLSSAVYAHPYCFILALLLFYSLSPSSSPNNNYTYFFNKAHFFHFPILKTSFCSKYIVLFLCGFQNWHKWYCSGNLGHCFLPNLFFFSYLYMLLCINLGNLIWQLHNISLYPWGPFHLSIIH